MLAYPQPDHDMPFLLLCCIVIWSQVRVLGHEHLYHFPSPEDASSPILQQMESIMQQEAGTMFASFYNAALQAAGAAQQAAGPVRTMQWAVETSYVACLGVYLLELYLGLPDTTHVVSTGHGVCSACSSEI